MDLYAHSLEKRPRNEWQTIDEHCRNVATLAARFAVSFKSAEWASILGILHDVGKARRSFQAYIARANGIHDVEYDASDHSHSGAGACLAEQEFGCRGRILAYVVAGHHAGLPDWVGGETPNGALSIRLSEEMPVLTEEQVTTYIKGIALPSKQLSPPFSFLKGRDLSFWIRMLFSCLVDADFLDTESFMDADRAKKRGCYPRLSELSSRFFDRLNAKQRTSEATPVNKIRAEIRTACETAADGDMGLFSLSVPTGGGKTLSSMAFAFRHAIKHNLKRIIYVIPYTSIIEQTANTLRDFLGNENVLEHHSNFDPEKETQQSRLASENWDAPIIVTTTVQFFESLYACKSSRCRKLHNIAESVVILDEVQLLPMRLLQPCIWAIQELVRHYSVSVVLSTATQPKLPGLNAREMIPSGLKLYERLKRTEWSLPDLNSDRQSWQEIATELLDYPQVLCVVNTRNDCRALFDLMPKGTIHLSAAMCGEHRSRVIKTIKDTLVRGEPIRVVSTQLVEAGVDIDFAVVYRAFTGLSSIAQSAGRCNREGRLGTLGRVVVFRPPKESPAGELRWGEYATEDVLRDDKHPSFNDSAVFQLYFSKLQSRAHSLGEEEFFRLLERDAARCQFQFREADKAFQMIDNGTVPILVWYHEGKELIEQVRKYGPSRDLMRRLQRYSITVSRGLLQKLRENGFVEEVRDGIYAQTLPSFYTEEFGFDLFRKELAPEDLIS